MHLLGYQLAKHRDREATGHLALLSERMKIAKENQFEYSKSFLFFVHKAPMPYQNIGLARALVSQVRLRAIGLPLGNPLVLVFRKLIGNMFGMLGSSRTPSWTSASRGATSSRRSEGSP